MAPGTMYTILQSSKWSVSMSVYVWRLRFPKLSEQVNIDPGQVFG